MLDAREKLRAKSSSEDNNNPIAGGQKEQRVALTGAEEIARISPCLFVPACSESEGGFCCPKASRANPGTQPLDWAMRSESIARHLNS